MSLQNQDTHIQETLPLRLEAANFDFEKTNHYFFKKLTYFVATEIKDPISIVNSQIQELETLLAKNSLSTDRLLKGLRSIASSNQKIGKITNQLRNLCEIGSPRPKAENIFLHQIVADTMELCQNRLLQHRFKSFLSVDPKLIVSVRSAEIIQILMHLIENSIQANGDNSNPWIQIEAFRDEFDAVLIIFDNGTGLPEKQLEKIFDPPPDGESLHGLPISAFIAGKNKGSLKVQRTPTNTKFILRLPLSLSAK